MHLLGYLNSGLFSFTIYLTYKLPIVDLNQENNPPIKMHRDAMIAYIFSDYNDLFSFLYK